MAAIGVFWNGLNGPFVFDDTPAILENSTIHGIVSALSPPHGKGLTVEGRPLLNLSFALNYAFGGTDTRGFHTVNLAIHAWAALILFGIVRRTLVAADRAPASAGIAALAGTGAEASALAFASALLWVVHPLQTESVTYIVQRAESLMGLFYLGTLYGFIRGAGEPAGGPIRWGWIALAVVSCAAGMATKEVMVSAPLIVLLYDRTFLSGRFRESLRLRGRVHLLLAMTIPIVLVLAFGTGTRGGTSGFGIGVAPWTYWSTQFEAVCHYLGLALWPQCLVFDYGVQWPSGILDVLPYAIGVALGAIWIGVLFVRGRASGFVGIFALAVLAPTSVIPGNRQTLAEHRMYLPLAAVCVVAVGSVAPILRRRVLSRWLWWGAGLLVCTAGTLGALTVRRNRDYRSALVLYRDTVAKRPGNAFAHYNLGKLLAESGSAAEAVPEYQAALRIAPEMPQAHFNLGNTLNDLGRREDALREFEAAVRADPGYAKARFNWGNTLLSLGRPEEALVQFRRATALRPDYVEARDNLAGVLLELGHFQEAEAELRGVLRLGPGSVETFLNLGTALMMEGHPKEAADAFEEALRRDPSCVPARDRLRALAAGASPSKAS